MLFTALSAFYSIYLQLYIHLFFYPCSVASIINTDHLALIAVSPYIPHHHMDISHRHCSEGTQSIFDKPTNTSVRNGCFLWYINKFFFQPSEGARSDLKSVFLLKQFLPLPCSWSCFHLLSWCVVMTKMLPWRPPLQQKLLHRQIQVLRQVCGQILSTQFHKHARCSQKTSQVCRD